MDILIIWNVTSNLPKRIACTLEFLLFLNMKSHKTHLSDWYDWYHWSDAFEQSLEQWRHQHPQHIPTVDSFTPVHLSLISMYSCIVQCVTSCSLRVLGVSGVSESQESWKSRSLRTMNCTIAKSTFPYIWWWDARCFRLKMRQRLKHNSCEWFTVFSSRFH